LFSHPMLAARDGRLLLAAQALDSLAIGVAGVALPWLILRAGGSHAAAGLVFSATVVPYLVFGLPAGAVGDRRSRRAVMLWAHAAQAAFAAAIPLWTISGTPPVAAVLVLAFAIGSGRVFADAATFGAIASVVGAERFAEGQAALSAAWGLGLFAGPALGGVLIAAVGPGFALASEAGACAVAALLVWAMRTGWSAPSEGTGAKTIAEGIRFIVSERGIATYTLLTMCVNLVGAGSYALLVPLLRDHVGLPAGRVGAILAAGELTALGAAAVVGPLTRRVGAKTLTVVALGVAALAMAGLGVTASFAAAAPVTVVFLLTESLISIVVIGERQRRAPDELQSRVGSAGRMVILGAVAVGSAIASGLTGALGLESLYLAMGAATLAVAVSSVPFLRRLD
jgi:MFS family permease